jgi:hypothetical protein
LVGRMVLCRENYGYHSKYNPVERVWGVLEKNWNGQILDHIDKVIGLARTMKWKGKQQLVMKFDKIYETGVRLSKSAMRYFENILNRTSDLEKWFIDIICFDI